MPQASNYMPLYQSAGQQYGIPPSVLAGIAQVESSGNPQAVSPAGAQGLMQVMPSNDASLGISNPNDPAQSVQGAAQLLAGYLKRANGNMTLALKMYHGGTDPKNWGPKTNAYPGQVMANAVPSMQQMDSVYGGKGPSAQPTKTPGGGSAMPTLSQMDSAYAQAPAQQTAPISDLGAALNTWKEWGQKALAVNNEVGAGIAQGLGDVINPPAAWLARQSDRLGVTPAINHLLGANTLRSGPQVAAYNAANMAQDAQEAGGGIPGGAGRLIGQAIPTLPLVEGALPAAANVLRGIGLGGVGDFIAGAAGRGTPGIVGAATRAASRATAGAASGAAYNKLTGAVPEAGAVIGGALGPAGGVVGDVAQAAAQRAAPLLDPLTRNLVSRAENLGIKLRPAQISDAPFVRYADSSLRGLPAMGYGADDAAVRGQFNGALANQMGETAQKITPDVMSAARSRISNDYETITPKLSIHGDDGFLTGLAKIQNEAPETVPVNDLGPINRQIDNILSGFKDGDTMSGEFVHGLIKRGSSLDKLTRSANPAVKDVAVQLRSMINDQMLQNAPPDLADKLRTANSQWKAMKTIEPLVEKSPVGDISPAALMQSVRKHYGNMAYNGGGAMGDLARIGQRFLKEPPNSGTANREFFLHALQSAGGLGAVAMSPEMGISHLASAGMLGGAVGTGRAIKGIINSDAYYNALMGRPGGKAASFLLQR